MDSYEFLALQQYLVAKSFGLRSIDTMKKCILKINGEDFKDELFERFPQALVEAVTAEIKRISYLTSDDSLGL